MSNRSTISVNIRFQRATGVMIEHFSGILCTTSSCSRCFNSLPRSGKQCMLKIVYLCYRDLGLTWLLAETKTIILLGLSCCAKILSRPLAHSSRLRMGRLQDTYMSLPRTTVHISRWSERSCYFFSSLSLPWYLLEGQHHISTRTYHEHKIIPPPTLQLKHTHEGHM